MKNYALLLFMIAVLLSSGFAGCSKNKSLHKKAQNYFERGDYDSATLLVAESLMLRPDYDKAFYTLKEAYPKANQSHLDQISALKNADNDDKWESILAEYLALDKLHQSVRKLPVIRDPQTGVRLSFELRDYSSEIKQARDNAAESYYQKGIHQSMIDSSRNSQKTAAGFFKSALKLVPNFKDSAARYEAARQNAIIRVAITAFEDKSGVRESYGAIADILTDLVVSRIIQDQSNSEFVEIITRGQMDELMKEQELSASGLVNEASAARIGLLLGAQEILGGRILQVDYVSPRITAIDLHETANVDIEDDIQERSDNKEVSCHFRKYTKSSSLQILASFSVVDVSTGRIKIQKSLSASQDFETEWGKIISGDERALNSSQKSLAKKSEPAAPTAKEMVIETLNALSRDIAAHFFDYIK
ncbi:MAG: CsgG/HfaB family protein [Candidatus Cloacimonetes bacterium]|jgi:tetratricopeptide (TPR) repeat protein|nr:CsgG/HfaB family protein [Candidatus Cloacimonadota bacterium]MCB5286915.1 CsgG/HfaB family protein [Candidatus Cloacimonadota bacterium]MCK9184143.1 CsgG/HfaB family protein [Candidatus Cloacimonadota bacterium]MCK9584372.1 CsgG/HfaB family protein [Candidatus Cloacimonadota bacterium]MDY0229236.1 CsgG/HfaB family protein [Candidatus Cloacimonadaceae bacterium]